jgi:exodeoxyribonuclease VII large subunit
MAPPSFGSAHRAMQSQVVTVSQVSDYLRLLTESDAFLSNLLVEGEVTDSYVSKAGHLYFTLSDGQSSLKAIAFRNVAIRFQHLVTQGAHLTVGGRVTVYSKDQTCQIYVEFVDAEGVGSQALALTRLRAQLEADGLFEVDRKRPLPPFPRTIGVVTSPSGAVIHDIQTVLRRRFPFAHLIVSPAQVQGAGAVDSLLTALDWIFHDGRSEIVIIARGGGSAEDLSAFNDERLARAVFAAPRPVISAIGHETDFSILDEVADLRAPTPTAAAELATPDIADFALELIDARERMTRSVVHCVNQLRLDLQQSAQRLDRTSPSLGLAEQRSRLVDFGVRLRSAVHNHLRDAQSDCRLVSTQLHGAGLRVLDRQRIDLARVEAQVRDLPRAHLVDRRNELAQDRRQLVHDSRTVLMTAFADLDVQKSALVQLNPAAVLKRGFAILTGPRRAVIGSVAAVQPGDAIQAIVRDGTIAADVTAVLPSATGNS